MDGARNAAADAVPILDLLPPPLPPPPESEQPKAMFTNEGTTGCGVIIFVYAAAAATCYVDVRQLLQHDTFQRTCGRIGQISNAWNYQPFPVRSLHFPTPAC
jgi:hypothetical protein